MIPRSRYCALALLAAARLALAGDVPIMSPDGQFSVPTVSMKEARYLTTLHQKYDFSCGSAAVATLLTHHYGLKVDESVVFKAMYDHGDQAKIRREGFSMLDMKRYIDSLGLRAEGVQASLDQLAQAGVPAIVLIRENGYAHFVVVKGVHAEEVVIGDPAAGTKVLARAEFEKLWMNRILLVVNNRVDLARFNRDEDWRVRPRAPLADGLHQRPADVLLLRPGPMDF